MKTFKFRWDTLLFFGVVLTTLPDTTGLTFHEWAGLALIVVIVVHLTLNWSWIIATTRQMFRRLPRERRFNHVLDFLLLIFMALTITSGIVVSRRALPTMGVIQGESDYFWEHMHGIFAYMAAALACVHLFAHLRWILTNLRSNPSGTRPQDREIKVGTKALVGRFIVIGSVSFALGFAVLGLARTSWAEDVREAHRRHIQEHPSLPPKKKKSGATTDKTKNQPNKAPEPTTTSVTPPAAQESRQP